MRIILLDAGERCGYNHFSNILRRHTNMTVTKEMTIGQIIMIDQGIIAILLNYGMHCIGCPSAQGESLEEACMVHGLDVDPLVEEINAYLSSK
jgi:hybrid cluster-associated redox disulfide protein